MTIHNLPTTYDPSTIEKKWYDTWETHGYFKPTLDKEKSFSIALPPPNVTGSLHMGHGFNNAIMGNHSLGLKKLLDNLLSV